MAGSAGQVGRSQYENPYVELRLQELRDAAAREVAAMETMVTQLAELTARNQAAAGEEELEAEQERSVQWRMNGGRPGDDGQGSSSDEDQQRGGEMRGESMRRRSPSPSRSTAEVLYWH